MLVIKNIKITFQRRVIPVKIRKIKVGYKKDTFQNQKKYHQIDSHTFQWTEDITLPLYYNVPLNFICLVDDVDYNPEDPNSELTSTLKIIDYKGSSQEAFLLNRQEKKVATLAISYKVSNQRLLIPQQKGVAVISSILAHLNHYKGSSGFIEISLGYKQIYTPTVNVIAGQLLWAQQLQLPVQQFKDKSKQKQTIVFTIYLDQQPKGKGSFQLQPLIKNHLKYKKFDILDTQDSTQTLGTLFIDITFRQRNPTQQTLNTQNSVANHRSGTNILTHKKNTDVLLNMRQPSQHFFNSNTNLSKVLNTPVKSSRSQSKLSGFGSYNSQATAKLLQKYEQKKKKIELNYNILEGIFNYGELNKQENIRHILKERRKKNKNQASLPKLK